ncbi:MAG: arabinan endo-1,5-alpha-L-arabinosidase [Planctomycetota bacterium]|jgi:arabinan endo-1,5-alpha-L-arabinosidase
MNNKNIVILVVFTLFSLTFFGCQSSDALSSFPPGSPQAREVAESAKLGPSIHDPSELQFENGHFMVFATGKGIRSWYRDQKTDNWKLADIIFPQGHHPQWWQEVFPDTKGYFWAPCVPSKWVMYYSFEADADYASAIGRAVATGTAPNLEWKDDGPVLVMPACREDDTWCPVAIDPSVFTDDKGNLYMAFGSGTTGIWIVELDPETGHLTAEAAEGFSEDNDAFHHVAYRELGEPRGDTEYIEAAYVYRHPTNGYYYLFVNWGQCCSGMDSTYQIMVGRSKSPTGPFIDKDGNDMVDQAGTILIETEGKYIGPGHASIYRHTDGCYAFSFHYYDGEAKGRPRLEVRSLTWPDDWPDVSNTDFFE